MALKTMLFKNLAMWNELSVERFNIIWTKVAGTSMKMALKIGCNDLAISIQLSVDRFIVNETIENYPFNDNLY